MLANSYFFTSLEVLIGAEKIRLIQIDFAIEYGRGGTGHEDVVAFSPLHHQIAAWEMNQNFFPGPVGEGTGYHSGAGAGSTGQCPAGTPLPDLKVNLFSADYLDEFNISLLREERIDFNNRT